MMQFSKSASSPVRLPHPPLMTFLGTTTRSRSKPRSRSSPLSFKNNSSSAMDSQQEPSSPKVTCIGQIRVRRSKVTRPSCGCFKSAVSNRRSLFLCLCCSGAHHGGDVAAPATAESDQRAESEREIVDARVADLVEKSSPPPATAENVVLMMRCRSAPYKSSSLLCRFWSSPPCEGGTLTAAAIPNLEEKEEGDDDDDDGGVGVRNPSFILARCNSAPL